MAYKRREHEADVGVLGIGDAVEESFEEGAKALFSVMADLDTIEPTKEITIECSAPELDSLFVEWLNELIAQGDIKELLFSDFSVKIEKNEDYKLRGTACGEAIDPLKHHLKQEVKAATYHGMKYETKEEQGVKKHYVQCVVDI